LWKSIAKTKDKEAIPSEKKSSHHEKPKSSGIKERFGFY